MIQEKENNNEKLIGNREMLENPDKITLTVNELAQLLGVSLSTSYELVNKEGCPYTIQRIGKKILIIKQSFIDSLHISFSI